MQGKPKGRGLDQWVVKKDEGAAESPLRTPSKRRASGDRGVKDSASAPRRRELNVKADIESGSEGTAERAGSMEGRKIKRSRGAEQREKSPKDEPGSASQVVRKRRRLRHVENDESPDEAEKEEVTPKRRARAPVKGAESPRAEVTPRATPRSSRKAAGTRGAEKSPASITGSLKAAKKGTLGDARLSLQGMKVVVTGVFDTMSREELELHIKRQGGSVMSMVSSRTDILVTGSALEDGRPIEDGRKYKKAIEVQQGLKPDGSKTKPGLVQILSEAAFLEAYPATPATSFEEPSTVKEQQTTTTLPPSSIAPSSPGRSPSSTKVTSTRPGVSSTSTQRPSLWVEKYRPREISQIVGNGAVVKKLQAWLTDWADVCLRGHAKSSPTASKRRFGAPELVNARCAMLSGPPGVGKTTAAHAVARSCGFEILEFNASDDRGKNIIEEISDMTSGGQTLAAFLPNMMKAKAASAIAKVTLQAPHKKVVLIMDEMDGLSAGDRGGAQALLKLIEKTQCPIICICNDRANPKLRTLVSKCYDLRFAKPPKNAIAERMCQVAREEGLTLDYNAVELLCERVGNDLRQILNTLQLMARRATPSPQNSTVTFDAMRKEIGYGLKDTQVLSNPFDACRRLLVRSEARSMSMNDRLDCFFVDYSIMPLFMQENYLQAFCGGAGGAGSLKNAEDVVAGVADCFTMCDILNVNIRKHGTWSFLSDIGFYSAVLTSCQCSGFLARAEFPRWFGKNSSGQKNRRLLGELQLHLAPVSSCTPVAMRTSGYLDFLYDKIMEPLATARPDGRTAAIEASIALMDAYGLAREDVIESMAALRLKQQERAYDLLDTAVKRQLTTLYNSSTHASRMVPMQGLLRQKAKKAKLGSASQEGLGVADTDTTAPLKDEASEGQTQADAREVEEDEEDDDAYLDKLIIAKKKRDKTAAARAKREGTQRARAKRAPRGRGRA